MRPRLIATGTLGLALALVWTTSFVFQRLNIAFLMNVASATDAPIAVRVAALSSLVQLWIPTLLALPVAALSIAAMLRVTSPIRLLRPVVVLSAALSVGALLLFAALAIPRVAAGESLLLPNPRIYAELLVALASLGLQIMLLALFKQIDTDNSGTSVAGLATDSRRKADSSLLTSGRDPQLAALPTQPIAAR